MFDILGKNYDEIKDFVIGSPVSEAKFNTELCFLIIELKNRMLHFLTKRLMSMNFFQMRTRQRKL
jgi:hypothetical protein